MTSRWSKPVYRIALVLICASLFPNAIGAQEPRRLALVGGMLPNGYDVPALHDRTTLIEGNPTVELGTASEARRH